MRSPFGDAALRPKIRRARAHVEAVPLGQQTALVLTQRGHLVGLALQDRRDLPQSQSQFPYQQDLLQPQQSGASR